MHRNAAGNASIPGNLLRFDATIKLSSAANRTRFAQDAVKGIVMTEAANHTSYQPVVVRKIPYSAKSPVRACASACLQCDMRDESMPLTVQTQARYKL